MATITTYGASGNTRRFFNGSEVIPCLCGQAHSGEHGSCQYLMHTCPHPGPLALDAATGLARCVACGRAWETNETL